MDSKSMLVYEGDYSIRLEYNRDYVIVHLPNVNRFTKEVLIDMKKRLSNWLDFFSNLGYNGIWAAVDPDDVKINKLLKKLNFEIEGRSYGYRVYRFGG